MASKRILAGLGLAAGLALTGCGDVDLGGGSASSGRGFERSYFQARTALEQRNYATAIRRYSALLDNSGPLQSRIRLELAHAYLRADQYGDASSQARIVAAAHQDTRRAAALAVHGTAEHRLAQEAMSAGDFGPGTRAHLSAADAALSEMLKTAPDLDPLGAMAERRRMVRASLKQMKG